MELKETVAMMLSENYKERFKAEYFQLKTRLEKLQGFIDLYEAGKLNFKPDCSLELLKRQELAMKEYFNLLSERADIEKVFI